MTDAYVEFLDPLAARGLRGVVWLGGWSNDTCSWEFDDARVRSLVTPIAGHPAILAYYLGDEPYYSWCPGGPAAYAARSALVHSLDPGRPTFTVIASYDPGNDESYPYGHWVGAVDILGLDIYPCNFVAQACDFADIDGAIAAAASAGIPAYWAVMQDFQDAYYRLPTPQELATEFDRWNASRMAGYFVFSWNYGAVHLDSQPSNVSTLAQENALHGWSR
jgi:hypothetical protein